MKTKIVLILMFVNFITVSFLFSNETHEKGDHVKEAYAQNVHMYICIEAFKLLKDRFPGTDFSVFENRIGTMNDCGTRPWQVGTVTAGACREDEEDVVYDIRGPVNLYASCSHFWDADNGDNSLTHLQAIGDYPNAYSKERRFVSGQWNYWSGGDRNYINFLNTDGLVYKFSYHTRGLINFFRTKTIWLHSNYNFLGQEKIIDREIIVNDYIFNKIVWEIVGRMAHLIQDISVPAHVHEDVHVREFDGGDCYHNYIDDGAYSLFNWQTAKSAGGFINPYEIGDDPIRYLMYTADQIADHFPSGPDCLEIPQQHFGNNNLPNGSYPVITQYYQLLGASPQNITDVYQEGNYCFNYAIRATAGLYYWFAVETGLIAADPGAYPVINSITKNLQDNTIYRGETLRLTCNASGSTLNYNWFFKVCDINNFCTIPITGLSFGSNQKTYSVSNFNFNNRWTCSFYDSLCKSIIGSSNVLLESPLKIILGVTVSNQFAQVTKYFGLNQPEKLQPFNGIRPPNPPPQGGCPFLLSQDTNRFNYENNALHRSTFIQNQNKDIEDKIVITNRPFLDTVSNTFQFALKEINSDENFFDHVSLHAVDHPVAFDVAVTEENNIVLIDKSTIRSAQYAEKNGEDITKMLAYDSAFEKPVKGSDKETINMDFDEGNNLTGRNKLFNELRNADFPEQSINDIPDSTALIFDPYESDNGTIQSKDVAGNISLFDSSGNKTSGDIEFARREMRSMVTIVLPVNNISRLSMNFKHGFNLTYAAAARVYYGGYNETELALTEAENSLTGDILKLLLKSDKKYASMDSNSFITLKFKNALPLSRKGWVRDYVVIINGKTIEGNRTFSRAYNQQPVTESENLPEIFSLEQNYPNPFNPKTSIVYQLPSAGDVKLKVYDILGNEIASLVNEKKNAGKYNVEFDGTNLSSGIYYYKLSAGTRVWIRKMILIK